MLAIGLRTVSAADFSVVLASVAACKPGRARVSDSIWGVDGGFRRTIIRKTAGSAMRLIFGCFVVISYLEVHGNQ